MTMNLYRVAPLPEVELLIVAPTTTKAAEIFMANTGRGVARERKFVIERWDPMVKGDWRANLNEVLARGVPGVAHYSEGGGWSV